MKISLPLAAILTFAALPVLVIAQEVKRIDIYQPPLPSRLNFTTLANEFGKVTNAVLPFLIGVAIVVVIWGIFRYIAGAGDSEKLAESRRVIIYGVIALFLMLSFWGFVMLIRNTLFV